MPVFQSGLFLQLLIGYHFCTFLIALHFEVLSLPGVLGFIG